MHRLLVVGGVCVLVLGLMSPAANAVVNAKIAAVGDIGEVPSGSGFNRQQSTAAESYTFTTDSGARVVAIGDTQYDDGTSTEYEGSWQAKGSIDNHDTWGIWSDANNGGIRSDDIRPVPGNHEYGCCPITEDTESPTDHLADGYRAEFVDDVAPPAGAGCPASCPESDKFNLTYTDSIGGWDWYFIDSQWCTQPSVSRCNSTGTATQTKYYNYVADLIPNADGANADCVAVVWHDPRFGTPQTGGTRVLMRDLYGLFDTEAGAELILSGSEHIYERYARLNKDGNTVTNNTAPRQFVVGTGGANPPGSLPTDSTAPDPISAGFDSGVLELQLYDTNYDYSFVGTLDNGDSGTGLYQDPPGGGFSDHTDNQHDCNNDPTV